MIISMIKIKQQATLHILVNHKQFKNLLHMCISLLHHISTERDKSIKANDRVVKVVIVVSEIVRKR